MYATNRRHSPGSPIELLLQADTPRAVVPPLFALVPGVGSECFMICSMLPSLSCLDDDHSSFDDMLLSVERHARSFLAGSISPCWSAELRRQARTVALRCLRILLAEGACARFGRTILSGFFIPDVARSVADVSGAVADTSDSVALCERWRALLALLDSVTGPSMPPDICAYSALAACGPALERLEHALSHGEVVAIAPGVDVVTLPGWSLTIAHAHALRVGPAARRTLRVRVSVDGYAELFAAGPLAGRALLRRSGDSDFRGIEIRERVAARTPWVSLAVPGLAPMSPCLMTGGVRLAWNWFVEQAYSRKVILRALRSIQCDYLMYCLEVDCSSPSGGFPRQAFLLREPALMEALLKSSGAARTAGFAAVDSGAPARDVARLAVVPHWRCTLSAGPAVVREQARAHALVQGLRSTPSMLPPFSTQARLSFADEVVSIAELQRALGAAWLAASGAPSIEETIARSPGDVVRAFENAVVAFDDILTPGGLESLPSFALGSDGADMPVLFSLVEGWSLAYAPSQCFPPEWVFEAFLRSGVERVALSPIGPRDLSGVISQWLCRAVVPQVPAAVSRLDGAFSACLGPDLSPDQRSRLRSMHSHSIGRLTPVHVPRTPLLLGSFRVGLAASLVRLAFAGLGEGLVARRVRSFYPSLDSVRESCTRPSWDDFCTWADAAHSSPLELQASSLALGGRSVDERRALAILALEWSHSRAWGQPAWLSMWDPSLGLVPLMLSQGPPSWQALWSRVLDLGD